MVHEVDLVCDYVTPRDWVTNWEPPELSRYTFKPVWRTTFKTPWDKVPNLLRIKLTSDVISLFLPSVNKGIFVYFQICRCGLWN